MPYQIQRLRPQLVEALFYDNFTKSSISSNKSDAFDEKIRNKKNCRTEIFIKHIRLILKKTLTLCLTLDQMYNPFRLFTAPFFYLAHI